MDFGYWYAQSEKTSNISEHYLIGDEISRGPFSVTYSATQLGLGSRWAVKHYLKKNFSKQKRPLDVSILLKPFHNNVARFKNLYETPQEIWVVSELVSESGLNIFDRFAKLGTYSELDVSKAIRQVIRALKYLHQECSYVHKDVHYRNVLFTGEGGPEDVVKLDNFHHSLMFPDDIQVQSVCSLPEFTAPEILLGKPADSAADMWAVGVMTYTLLSGQHPFEAESPEVMYRKIIKNLYNFDDPVWEQTTRNARNFVQRLLQFDPAKRMNVDEALKHFWISGGAARSHPPLTDSSSRFCNFVAERMNIDDSWWVSRLPTLAPAAIPEEVAVEPVTEENPFSEEIPAGEME